MDTCWPTKTGVASQRGGPTCFVGDLHGGSAVPPREIHRSVNFHGGRRPVGVGRDRTSGGLQPASAKIVCLLVRKQIQKKARGPSRPNKRIPCGVGARRIQSCDFSKPSSLFFVLVFLVECCPEGNLDISRARRGGRATKAAIHLIILVDGISLAPQTHPHYHHIDTYHACVAAPSRIIAGRADGHATTVMDIRRATELDLPSEQRMTCLRQHQWAPIQP